MHWKSPFSILVNDNPKAAETSIEIQMTRRQITDPSATKEMLFLTEIGKIENYIQRKFAQLNRLSGR